MIETMAKAAEVAQKTPEQNSKMDTFNPDQRNGLEVKNEKLDEAKQYNPDERITEIKPDKDGFYTKLKDRIKYTPKDLLEGGFRGSWDGERGNSLFRPKYEFMKNELKKYGVEGINYKNGEADFSPVVAAIVKIDNMTAKRYGKGGNFEQANTKLAEQFNKEKKDGRSDWSARDVDKWRKENKLSWHECCDCKTMELVPEKIHGYFKHSGGCAECKVRDGIKGGFDE